MNLLRFSFKAKNKNGSWVFAYFDESGRQLEWRFSSTYGYGNPSQIDTETLCQSTGILDADDELIYEHDYLKIIRTYDNNHVLVSKAEVIYEQLKWFFSIDGRKYPLLNLINNVFSGVTYNIYIIGNKFD